MLKDAVPTLPAAASARTVRGLTPTASEMEAVDHVVVPVAPPDGALVASERATEETATWSLAVPASIALLEVVEYVPVEVGIEMAMTGACVSPPAAWETVNLWPATVSV